MYKMTAGARRLRNYLKRFKSSGQIKYFASSGENFNENMWPGGTLCAITIVHVVVHYAGIHYTIVHIILRNTSANYVSGLEFANTGTLRVIVLSVLAVVCANIRRSTANVEVLKSAFMVGYVIGAYSARALAANEKNSRMVSV